MRTAANSILKAVLKKTLQTIFAIVVIAAWVTIMVQLVSAQENNSGSWQETELWCEDRNALTHRLDSVFGESLQIMGITDNESSNSGGASEVYLEVWINHETGTWTVLTSFEVPNGIGGYVAIACIFETGHSLRMKSLTPAGSPA